jgi:hypothetical protein
MVGWSEIVQDESKCRGEVYEPSPKDGVLKKYKTSKG